MSSNLELQDGRRMVTVPLDEVIWIEAAGNYVEFHGTRRDHLIRHTLKAVEARLDGTRFLRIRPSAIVCLDAVTRMDRTLSGDFELELCDGTCLRSSRSYRRPLLSLWHARRQASAARVERNASAESHDRSASMPAASAAATCA